MRRFIISRMRRRLLLVLRLLLLLLRLLLLRLLLRLRLLRLRQRMLRDVLDSVTHLDVCCQII
jgi:hypothetical protein